MFNWLKKAFANQQFSHKRAILFLDFLLLAVFSFVQNN